MPGFGLGRLAACRTVAVDHLDEAAQDLRHTQLRSSRDNQRRLLCGALQPCNLLLELFGRERVCLAERDDLRFLGEAVAVGLELAAHRLVVLAGMLAGAVNEMQQHAAALDMAEEAVAESNALMGIL